MTIIEAIERADPQTLMRLYMQSEHEASWRDCSFHFLLGENAIHQFGEECYEEDGCEYETLDRENVGYIVVDSLKENIGNLQPPY